MDKIRVLLVDDEKLIREGLKMILSTYEDIVIAGTCENGEAALNACREKEVDVVLMDIRMPMCDGVQGTKLIKNEFFDIKILILTTFNDGEYIHEALKYGASGYLLKDSSEELIYEGIKAVLKGNVVVHPEVATKIISHSTIEYPTEEELCSKYGLSAKELIMIREIANGLSNKEIGERLFLSEGTIKNNISGILAKLNLRDRTQIVIFAFKCGLVR